VPDGATVHDLREAIQAKLGVEYHDQQLSRDQGLLREASNGAGFKDMIDTRATLSKLGLGNGDMVFLRYHARDTAVEPVARPTAPTVAMDIKKLSSRWERIEREKEGSAPPRVSFDQGAAGAFQGYIQQYLSFSSKRGGVMYGTFEEDGGVRVEAIYEPRQEGGPLALDMKRGTGEEELADSIAAMLGLSKVGVIFSQSTAEREHELSAEEVVLMARAQRECGGQGVTAVVSLWEEDDGARNVHFEAYCVSRQLERLVADGWVTGAPADSNVVTMRNPAAADDATPLIVNGRDVGEAEVEWFLQTVPIVQHQGALRTAFPVENRILNGTAGDLKKALAGPASLSYQERMKDFHLLLWLAQQGILSVDSDLPLLVHAVRAGQPIMEGYKIMIDSLAEH